MIYIQIEPSYADYTWCQQTLQGIHDEAKRKRVNLRRLTSPDQIDETGSCLLLLGASEEWINTMAVRSRQRGAHPIALSSRLPNSSHLPLSSVTMDLYSSTQLAVNYLHHLGRFRLAMYGINPSSASDPWRTEVFKEVTGRGEHIFYNNLSLEDTFRRFYPVAEQYDGVICANDYAAVSLLRRLQESGYDVPEKLYIISYGDMQLARLCSPSITSIADDYALLGRSALAACGIVERTGAISTINIHLNSRLHIRQTTQNRPYCPDYGLPAAPKLGENRFFSDPEVSSLARLETLFSECDETDFALIRLIRENTSYTDMAQQCFISETAVKYRVRKMEKLCGVDSRQKLALFLKDFF